MKKKIIACVSVFWILIFGFVFKSFSSQDDKNIVTISPRAASDLITQKKGDSDFVILDIRTPAEFNAGHIPNSILIDFYSKTFAEKIQQLDRTKTYLVYCRSGNRSRRSLELFKKLKFRKVYHMDSGIIGWKSEGLPIIK
ncbi:MAG: rhodanese-like domain-containing protein [Deltaproteobacteria bacterium]|nr:rhodanese-like domain-containing protein [Deltaproteobacteria bacterium]MBW1994943.1 rhodanese-like domain-containing protein [Deltaproteobacteria bacterium]MBW2154033.1 rhodanese-like domain-containing protein [Deltaproteobacteria bacterium]